MLKYIYVVACMWVQIVLICFGTLKIAFDVLTKLHDDWDKSQTNWNYCCLIVLMGLELNLQSISLSGM